MKKLVSLALLVILTGCQSGPRLQPAPMPAVSPQAFWSDQQQRSGEVSKVLGKLSIRYHSKKQNLSGQGRVVGILPDRMRLEVRDPLGKVQYLVTLNAPALVAYYPSQKLAYSDEKSGSSYLKRFTGLNISFGDLQSLWLGLLPDAFRKTPFTEWAWDPAKGAYRASLSAGEHRITCFVDANLHALRELYVESAAEPIRVTYSDFEPCCGGAGRVGAHHLPVAQTVAVVLEKSQTSMEVQWDEIKRLDGERNAELFQPALPEGVQTVLLK